MWISQQQVRDKVEGCWIGKNIGGTLGGPFEGVQGILDVGFYTQELNGEPMPNDDLDLQLAWLVAVERFGNQVNSNILGEYWLSHIHPNWSEYGFCKNNMRAGLMPPLSGSVNNSHANSNGAWIRSEIWACLAPGHPDVAASYATEDASVDHSQEGVYSAAFCAALQSAAFVESDKFRLIHIGLSYIPDDCGVAQGVRLVMQCYSDGVPWKQARKRLFMALPHHFGARMEGELDPDIPVGEVGYDAPANIGIFILGWLYGEDDFGQSMCLAVNCGADTDCTAATLGAVWGIIHGAAGIPAQWKEPIGRSIKTICLNGDMYTRFPSTVDELTDRILNIMPKFLDVSHLDLIHGDAYRIRMKDASELHNKPPIRNYLHPQAGFHEYYYINRPYAIKFETPIFYCWFDYQQEPALQSDEPFEVLVSFHNRIDVPHMLNLKWVLPEGWSLPSHARETMLPLPHHFGAGRAQVRFTIQPNRIERAKEDAYLDIRVEGRHTRLVIPATFYAF
jgi:ADP-ribosylglycohydrolase